MHELTSAELFAKITAAVNNRRDSEIVSCPHPRLVLTSWRTFSVESFERPKNSDAVLKVPAPLQDDRQRRLQPARASGHGSQALVRQEGAALREYERAGAAPVRP